jgi:hypothetical protein
MELLQPSTEARRVTVFLKRDWTTLTKAIAELEQRVHAWNNDFVAATSAARVVFDLAKQAEQAKEKVAAMLEAVAFAGQALSGVPGISSATLQCGEAARLRSSIQTLKSEADAKEQAIKSLLDRGAIMAASCSTAQDGDSLRALYRNATQLARAVNELARKAQTINDELKTLGSDNQELTKILGEVERKVAELVQEATRAEAATRTAETNYVSANNLYKNMLTRHRQLSGELATLKANFGFNNPVSQVPPELDRRVETMFNLLGKENNNLFGAPAQDSLKAVQEAAAQIQHDRKQAEKLLATSKRSPAASCDFEPLDEIVRQIGTINTGITIELGAAALNEKAEACIKKGNCQPILNNVPALLEQGAIEQAASKINEARAKGCNIGDLNEQLDYWKSIRDGVLYLEFLRQQCQFREAYEVTLKMPKSILDKPLMAETIARLTNGKKTQERIWSLQDRAKAEVTKTKKMTSAEPFIQEAEQVAAPYACLAEEVSNFRRMYQVPGNGAPGKGVLGAPVDKPNVEDIPDDVTEAAEILSKIKKGSGTTQVEEIPEVAIGPKVDGNVSRPGKRRPPDVEEIPEVGGKQDTGKQQGKNPPAGVRPCNADELAAFASMSGTWGARGPKITISGSCEQASGSMSWAEYCEDPNSTFNASLPRYKGTFKGRMEGASLQVNWDLPGGSVHPDQKGRASCSMNSDGTLSCSGFGCGVGGKKQ